MLARLVSRPTCLAGALAVAMACGPPEDVPPAAVTPKQAVMSVRSGPQSLNWFTRHDSTTYLISLLTQARLVRINAATQRVEPWLAERWQRLDDGRRYRLSLRPGLRFSDGSPLSVDDVLFSFDAAFDRSSVLGDALTVGGTPVRAERVDALTVDVVFPRPYGPELRVLDALPILPKHRLQSAMDRGTFGEAWSTTTPPSDIVGLGPFVLVEHQPGVKLVFDRNPHYFRTSTDGGRLPRLDRLVLQILPDQDAQLLSLQAAESDGSASEIRPADYPQMKRLADAGRVQLLRLGTSLNPDGLWVNLRADAFNGDSRKPWLQRDEVRQAISAGIDRARFADVVFSGAADPASSPVTSSNKDWSRPDAPPETFDAARAKALLASAGLVDRDGDGFVDDVGTRHARFTVLTQKGQTSLERGAGEIREQMRLIGLELDVVLLDAPALIQRFLSGANYDAVYFNLTTTDTDPASQVDFWRRDGAAHVWNLGAGTSALPWEREIDALMDRQVTSLDVNERRRLFWAVQARFDEHRPIVYFAAPHVYVAVSTRLSGLAPALTRPQLLWSADTIDVAP